MNDWRIHATIWGGLGLAFTIAVVASLIQDMVR
jgi:hypothetical protein